MDVDNNYLLMQTYMYSYLLVDSNSIYGINGDIDQYHAVYYYAHGSAYYSSTPIFNAL